MPSLDIDTAIAAHTAWIKRLRFFMDGISDGQMNIDQVGDDTRCALGSWLYGAGSDYDLLKQYHELVTVHREFHRVAAEVVEAHQRGDEAIAERLYADRFMGLSRDIVALLNELRLD